MDFVSKLKKLSPVHRSPPVKRKQISPTTEISSKTSRNLSPESQKTELFPNPASLTDGNCEQIGPISDEICQLTKDTENKLTNRNDIELARTEAAARAAPTNNKSPLSTFRPITTLKHMLTQSTAATPSPTQTVPTLSLIHI